MWVQESDSKAQPSTTGQENQVEARICTIVEKLLGLQPGRQQPLMEAGLDSLGALELHNLLCTEFDCVLPATTVFDFPNISALTGCIKATLSPPITDRLIG